MFTHYRSWSSSKTMRSQLQWLWSALRAVRPDVCSQSSCNSACSMCPTNLAYILSYPKPLEAIQVIMVTPQL